MASLLTRRDCVRKSLLQPEQWVSIGNTWACPWTTSPPSWKSEEAKRKRSTVWKVRMGPQYLSFHSVLAADKRVRKKRFLHFLAFGYNNTLIELIKMPCCPLIALRRWSCTAHAHTCGLPATSRRAWDDAQKCPRVSVYGEENVFQILPLQSEFFFFKHLYWSIIALQWCVSFCFTTKWISYTYTYVPISLPSCISLPPTLPIPPL